MKSKFLLLVKNNLKNTYKLSSMSNKKKGLFLLLMVYVVAVLFLSLKGFLQSMYDNLDNFGISSYYIILLFALAAIFSFFFSIFSAKSELFDNKDSNLLLSLPVTKKDVLASKVFIVILFNFILGLMFIVPGLYVYLSANSITLVQGIILFVLFLFSPIIPSVLSSLFGYLVAKLISKTKSKSMFELIYYTLFIFIYMFAVSNGNDIIASLASKPELLNSILKYVFFPIYLIGKSFMTGNGLYTLLFVIVNTGIFMLFIGVMNKSYFKIISQIKSHKTSSNYKMSTLQTRSVQKALRHKEIKRYFSSAIYVFNTLFGVLFILIGAVATIFVDTNTLLEFIDFGEGIKLSTLVLVFVAFVTVMTDTTNSCISIERENFWITKMIPVKTKDIFDAKRYVNKIILIPPVILSLIIFNLTGLINFYELLLLIAVTVVLSYFVANFGLIVNLAYPKFDAANDAVIVKQSAASMVGILGGMSLFGIMALIISSFHVSGYALFALVIAIGLIFYLITELIINKWGIKRFTQIS